jgi:hypothetical protein
VPYKPTGSPPGRPKKIIPPDDGQFPDLPANQRRAIDEEVRPFLEEGIPVITRYVQETWRVALAADVDERTIQRWRKDELYRRGFTYAMQDTIRLLQNDTKHRRVFDYEYKWEAIAWLSDNWKGPITSPLNGKVYYDVEDYAEHVVHAGAFKRPQRR